MIEMSQCVPSWDLEDSTKSTPPARLPLRSRSNSTAPDVPLLDYEVAELTWENGQIAMHGLGPPRVPNKTLAANWEKPRAGGTLESIVNQATRSSSIPLPRGTKPPIFGAAAAAELVPWLDHNGSAAAAASNNTMTMDAQVPCSNRTNINKNERGSTGACAAGRDSVAVQGLGTCGGGGVIGSYTQVASCSGTATQEENGGNTLVPGTRGNIRGVSAAREWSSRVDPSVSGTSATFGSQQQLRNNMESCERSDRHLGLSFASTSMGSPENASSGKPSTKGTTADDHDSVSHSRPQRESGDEEEDKKKRTGKSSVSTKRSRAAAIHNQSERKRRDKINQRMKTLQKLVPNSSKTDKASMLDEVIDYLKQLQAQVQMMSRMNMPAMMAMQQQLQMSMMNPMGMGMGMAMDMNSIARSNLPAISPVLHPNPFMPMTSWDASAAADARLQPQLAAVIPDPLSSFFACQSQPMATEAYNRMAAMYQQLHQPPASNSKS